MKVAELSIMHGRGFSQSLTPIGVGFTDVAAAKAEYDRLVEFLDRREKRANDLEKTITVVGITSFTCPSDEINGVGFCDFASMNEEEAGVRDAFPNLFKR